MWRVILIFLHRFGVRLPRQPPGVASFGVLGAQATAAPSPALPPARPQLSRHSRSVAKLLALPSQPPKTKLWQAPAVPLNHQRGIEARHRPTACGSQQSSAGSKEIAVN